MAKTKQQKEKILEDLVSDLKKQKSTVVVDIQKLKFKDLFQLRRKVKAVGGKLKAIKKTLLGIAFKKTGFEQESEWPGEVAVVLGLEEPVKPIKSVYELARKNENLKILGGIFEGKVVAKEAITALAQLPSREELLAKLVGSIASPMSGFLNVLQGNIKGLVLVLSAIKK